MTTVTTASPRSGVDRQPRPRRRLAVLLAASLLTPGLLAGCSSAGGGPAGGDAASSSDAAAVGQCVRDAGYDVVDDDFTNPGLTTLPDGVAPESSEADTFLDVVSGCHDSAGSGSLQVSGDEKDAFVQEMLTMAQCLRDEGFDDVPDPVDGVWSSPEHLEGQPAYEKAIEKCQAGMDIKGL